MLTLEATRTAARAVVAERGPNFIYRKAGTASTCLYVKADDERLGLTPDELDIVGDGARVTGCLVGTVLDHLGLMTDSIATSHDGVGSLIGHTMFGQVEHDVRKYLVMLQCAQDDGETWGAALQSAENYVS